MAFLRASTAACFLRCSRQFRDNKNRPVLVPVPGLYDHCTVPLTWILRVALFPKLRVLVHPERGKAGLLNLFHNLLRGELRLFGLLFHPILARYIFRQCRLWIDKFNHTVCLTLPLSRYLCKQKSVREAFALDFRRCQFTVERRNVRNDLFGYRTLLIFYNF